MLKLEKAALAQKLEVMERGAVKVMERVDGVEKEVATGMEKAKEEVKKDVKTEMLQREEQSCNIVIYGLEETMEDEADKWREGKTDKVAELVGKIGVQIEGKVAVKFQTEKRHEVGEKLRP